MNTLLQNLLNRFYPKVLYLFKYGSNYEDITGGFEALPYYHKGYASNGTAPTLNISSSGMSIKPTSGYGSVWSKKQIDVTTLTELHVKFTRSTITNSGGSLGLCLDKKQAFEFVKQYDLFEKASGEYVFDVSDIDGLCYFCVDVNNTAKSDTLLFDFIELK